MPDRKLKTKAKVPPGTPKKRRNKLFSGKDSFDTMFDKFSPFQIGENNFKHLEVSAYSPSPSGDAYAMLDDLDDKDTATDGTKEYGESGITKDEKMGALDYTNDTEPYWIHAWNNDELYIWEVNSKKAYLNFDQGFIYIRNKVLETVKAKRNFNNNGIALPSDYDEKFLRFVSMSIKGQANAKGTNFWFKKKPGWDNSIYNDLNPDFKDKADRNLLSGPNDKAGTGFYYVKYEFEPALEKQIIKDNSTVVKSKEFKVFQKQEDRPLESDSLRKQYYDKRDVKHKKENDEIDEVRNQKYKWSGLDEEGIKRMRTYNMLQKETDKVETLATKDTWYDIEGIGGGGMNMNKKYLIERGVDPSKVRFVYNKDGSTGFWEASKTTKYDVYYNGEKVGSVSMILTGFKSGETYAEVAEYIKKNKNNKELVEAVKNAYHIRWSDTTREADVRKNDLIDIISSSLGGTLDLATILTEGTIASSGELGFGAAKGIRYYRNNFLKNYSSTDPLVGSLATDIEKELPGSVKKTNKDIIGADGKKVTDFDIELQEFVIQVKSGSGKGATSQIERTRSATTKQVILYGPDLGGSVQRGAREKGALVFTNKQQLLNFLKEHY